MYSIKKIQFLKRQEQKREKGLLRDSEGMVIVPRPPVRSRTELLKRMREMGYGR
jgi:hypothetical protein